MIKNVFEESEITLTGTVTGGKPEEKKDVKFKFDQKGGDAKIAEATVQLKGDVAEHTFKLPKIKDDEDNYSFTYKIEAAGQTLPGEAEYRVWPKNVELQAVDKDDKEFASVEFKVIQSSGKVNGSCDGSGKAPIQLADPEEFTLDAISPYKLDSWVTEKGRKRKAKFSVAPYRVVFHSPEPGSLKQYVNTAKNANVLTVKVGAEGDDKAPKAERKAKKGDPIYVKVEFGEDESKRDTPKREAVGFTDDGSGRVFTKKLEIPKDGAPAEFKVNLGLAGGDTCTLSAGSTEECEETTISVENWRKLYYQLTLPKGESKPDMTRMIDALSDVFIEYEEYKKIEVDEKDGPNLSWFPGDWLNEPGKKFLNIGDHNKSHFHGKFSDKKSPIGVHILCCHTQYDCKDPSTAKDFPAVEVDNTKTTPWSDGNTYAGTYVWVGRGLFPKKMKDGTSTLMSGSWKEVGGKGKGSISEADLWVDRKTNPGWAFIKLPDKAKQVVDAGGKVQLKLKIYCALGPYLGESDGKKGWLQLIVVKQKDNVINDVMAHELGHTMHQVTAGVAPGLDANDHGRKYTGNGHQGPH
ncbi:MAG TPA: hypothetical protein VG496_13960, partial [Myxococcales bacterium]|nr:hypothetical protein [Myxococcales bacterium]